MPLDPAEVFENTTELGEDRVPAPAPTQEFLRDLRSHLFIREHQKPSVFTEACNDLCRFGYDHPDIVGTTGVLESLFSALKYKPDHDDEDEGVPRALRDVHTPGIGTMVPSEFKQAFKCTSSML